MTNVTIEKEKLEKVLEALELSSVMVDSFGLQKKMQEAHATIKQALAAPNVQEPTIAACIIGADAVGKKIDGYEAAKVYAAMQKAMGTPPAAPVQPVQEPIGRTDRQIVDQTEELAVWLLSWCFNHQPETDTPMRESTHPFAERCWAAACHIQEMLTATDPENAVAELDVDDTPPAAQPAPESGSWYAASDIDKMVRDLDVAMNGDGAAPQAKLCDLMPQLIQRLTQPAQRTWVGLTEAERKKIEKRHIFVEDAIRLTEAKLKEKNV